MTKFQSRKFIQSICAQVVISYIAIKTTNIEWGLMLLASAGIYNYFNIKDKKRNGNDTSDKQ